MKIVRYVGKGRKLPPEYKKAISKGTRTAIINTLRDGGNVTLRVKLDGKRVELNNDSLTRDFLDLATLIYIVDELEPRTKAKDHWSRRFDVLCPVKRPKLWAKHEDTFGKMLRTLAGDEYHFTWLKRPKLDSLGHHRETIPTGFDAVCLFSGGMDSFLGANTLLSEGKKLLLVGHQADGTAASAQKALATWLQKKFPDACHLIQCRVARSFAKVPEFRLPTKREETHRPRSLLFIALAVAIANATGASTIYLPENGLRDVEQDLRNSRFSPLRSRGKRANRLVRLCPLHRGGIGHELRSSHPLAFKHDSFSKSFCTALASSATGTLAFASKDNFRDRNLPMPQAWIEFDLKKWPSQTRSRRVISNERLRRRVHSNIRRSPPIEDPRPPWHRRDTT